MNQDNQKIPVDVLIHALPPELQDEVRDFIEALLYRYAADTIQTGRLPRLMLRSEHSVRSNYWHGD